MTPWVGSSRMKTLKRWASASTQSGNGTSTVVPARGSTAGVALAADDPGQTPFAGRFKPVKTREQASPPLATAASLEHLVRLRLRLKPGLYRVSVRAVLDDGRLSSPKRVFLRVLRR
jgi:hypothetical protein